MIQIRLDAKVYANSIQLGCVVWDGVHLPADEHISYTERRSKHH